MEPTAGTNEWTRAGREPVPAGGIRRRAADFRVDEVLGFEPSGDGQHLLIRVEKTGRNTVDAARVLAGHAAVPLRDVGYSGLKDKHALCTQWFSVPWSPRQDWRELDAPGIRILRTARHHRKLRRGTHAVNRFSIRIELDRPYDEGLERGLDRVRRRGVPNYFGEQRFARHYVDNARRLAAGEKLARLQRSMTLSALRADLFNRVVDRRVREGSWDTALPGEYVNLDGTRSGFAARDDDPEIPARVAAMDLHPTGPLFGDGPLPARGEAAALEAEILDGFAAWREVLIRHGLRMERRATRCVVRGLDWRAEGDGGILSLSFTLRRGQFATSVLREIVDYRDLTRTAPGLGSGLAEPG